MIKKNLSVWRLWKVIFWNYLSYHDIILLCSFLCQDRSFISQKVLIYDFPTLSQVGEEAMYLTLLKATQLSKVCTMDQKQKGKKEQQKGHDDA